MRETQADLGRLPEILKGEGAEALPSIRNESARLEGEQRLESAIGQLADRQHPLREKTGAAERFLRTWARIGDLLDDLPAEEKQQVHRHSVEVIEFRGTDASGKVGVYTLRLFPEVRKFPGSDAGSCGVRSPPGTRKSRAGPPTTWRAIPSR